jgi:hypothetical protein
MSYGKSALKLMVSISSAWENNNRFMLLALAEGTAP